MLKRLTHGLILSTLLSIAAAGVGTVQAQEVKVPATAQDHLDLAKVYEDKVATYRKEVDFHKKMFESYQRQASPTGKAGPNPWVTKMKKHCQMLIKDAEKLVKDAETSAEFHKLRAKELEGK